MKNQYIGVDITVTNLDRAITYNSAVLGEPEKKKKIRARFRLRIPVRRYPPHLGSMDRFMTYIGKNCDLTAVFRDLPTLAKTFQVSHYSTVSVAISRLRSRQQADAKLAVRLTRLARQLDKG